MGLKPGAVTPLALIHKNARNIKVVLEYGLAHCGNRQRVNFHPGVNTANINIACDDFRRYLESCGNTVITEDAPNQYFFKIGKEV